MPWSSDGDVGGNNGESEVWVLRIEEQGNVQWEENFGGSNYEQGYSIIQNSDGKYVVAGETASSDGDIGGLHHGGGDQWVLKLAGDGSLQWEENYGGSYWDQAREIIRTSDGGFAIAGESNSADGDLGGNYGFKDAWIVKLDSNGVIQWEKNLGGTGVDEAWSIVEASDGGYVMAGHTSSTNVDVDTVNGSFDYWVVKLDSSGGIQWEENYGGSGFEWSHSLLRCSDGGYAVAGQSESSDHDVGGNQGGKDYWIVKLDSAGTIQWEQNLGGSDDDVARSLIETSDGGFAVAGYSESSDGDVGGNHGKKDYWIAKLDAKGQLQGEMNLGGSGVDSASSLIQTTDQGYLITGKSHSNDGDVGGHKGNGDVWVVKLDRLTELSQQPREPSFSVHPNPTEGKVRIELGGSRRDLELIVRDIRGRTLNRIKVEKASNYTTRIEGDAGLYFVELRSKNEERKVRKVVKQ